MFKNNRLDTYYVKADHRKETKMKFKYKDKVFKENMKIYIGNNKIEEEINTYRQHKNFDMITLLGYNNINEVLKYKGENVYILESDLNLNDNEVPVLFTPLGYGNAEPRDTPRKEIDEFVEYI